MKDPRPELTTFVHAIGGVPRFAESGPHRYVESFTISVGEATIQGTPNVGSKGGLLGVTLTLPLRETVSDDVVILRKETAIDRAGKKLGINVEMQTDDPAFDALVYVESDASEETLQRMLSADVRSLVTTLLRVDAIRSLTIQSPMPSRGDMLSSRDTLRIDIPARKFQPPGDITAVLGEIVQLGDALARTVEAPGGPYGRSPGEMGRTPAPARRMRLGRGLGALGVAAAMFIATIALDRPPTFNDTSSGIAIGTVLWVVAAAIIIKLFRGRATSFRTVIVFTLLYITVFPFSVVAFAFANAALDHSEPVLRSANATLQVHSKGPNDVSVTAPWRAGAKVTVPFARVHGSPHWRPAQAVTAKIHPGAFGWEWIESIDVD